MSKSSGNEFEAYDIPKPATPVNYDCPKSIFRTSPTSLHLRLDSVSLNAAYVTFTKEQPYDVPRPSSNLKLYQNGITPSSSNSSLLASDGRGLSMTPSNRSSLAILPDYDVPRRNPLPVRASRQIYYGQRQPYLNGDYIIRDFPSSINQQAVVQKCGSTGSLPMITKELSLDLSTALETLAKLQMEVTTAITRLLFFVAPNWRVCEKFEPELMKIKMATVRLRTALYDLIKFGEAALGSAFQSENPTLVLKLRPLVRALLDADKVILDSSECLDTFSGLAVNNVMPNDNKPLRKPPDSLEQLNTCAQTLIVDVRQITCFIQGNASLLFKRHPSCMDDIVRGNSAPDDWGVVETVHGKSDIGYTIKVCTEFAKDNDYVDFESVNVTCKKNTALPKANPTSLKKFDNMVNLGNTQLLATSGTQSEPVSLIPESAAQQQTEFTGNDKLLVHYYAEQISTHICHLRQAIDSFLGTVEKNQPPTFFFAYGKFVLHSAHNLVTIGDILHRNVSMSELREKIFQCTDTLSAALKECVIKSKMAATQFPSVTAVQDMVNSVVNIIHLASNLKTCMLHAVKLST